ncbi:MAG: ammonium transporter [Phycisphaerales bacterium]|nr:ammonium transporter [Phycisphaerales bacterium]
MPFRDLSVYLGVVLLIRIGQTLLLAGTVRSKNAAGAAVRCVLDLAVVLLSLWAIGGIFVPKYEFGADGVGRTSWLAFSHVLGNDLGSSLSILPVLMIATIAPLGATAERVRLLPLLAFSALTGAVLLPALARIGLAFQGESVHTQFGLMIALMGGGAAALGLAWVAGARKGKFNRDLSVNFVPGHAVVYQFVGLLLLAAGFGAATWNGLHALLGLCSGALAGAAFGRFRFGKIDAGLLVAAAIGGLCAGGMAAVLEGGPANWLGNGGGASVLAGALAGCAVPWAVMVVETRLRLDDVAGFGVAYTVGGTIGTVLAALTRHTATVGSYFGAAAVDLAIWALAVVVFGGAAVVIGKFFAGRNQFRVTETVEYDGVDLSDLDVNAYPDFQQIMIKSHHLRQL